MVPDKMKNKVDKKLKREIKCRIILKKKNKNNYPKDRKNRNK